MKDGPSIARIAALIGDHARAEVLTALMADRALTATELANIAGVTKQTISAHMAKLVDAELVAVECQGRHRYFRLANQDVAHLLESLMGVAFRTGAVRTRSSPREPALRKARVCYDHLAGELAVAAYDSLLARGYLIEENGASTVLSQLGREWLNSFGVNTELAQSQKRIFCRSCLDWSERRSHLAGAIGSAILNRIFELGWAFRSNNSRVVNFSAEGERAFLVQFLASSNTQALTPKEKAQNATA
jgi:DNA-binding transcriptional ArsR family regulator